MRRKRESLINQNFFVQTFVISASLLEENHSKNLFCELEKKLAHRGRNYTRQLFKKFEKDTCLFVRRFVGRNQYLLSWFDDIINFTNEDNEASEIRSSLEKLKKKLGMQNQMKDGAFSIAHKGCIFKIIKKLKMSDCGIAYDDLKCLK